MRRKMMKRLSVFVKYFTFITTGVLIANAIVYNAYNITSIHASDLWKILLAGAVTALVTVAFHTDSTGEKEVAPLMMLCHYATICVVMVIMGTWFGWMKLNALGILVMCVTVAAVYGFTYLMSYLTGKRDADEINKALLKRKGEKHD